MAVIEITVIMAQVLGKIYLQDISGLLAQCTVICKVLFLTFLFSLFRLVSSPTLLGFTQSVLGARTLGLCGGVLSKTGDTLIVTELACGDVKRGPYTVAVEELKRLSCSFR